MTLLLMEAVGASVKLGKTGGLPRAAAAGETRGCGEMKLPSSVCACKHRTFILKSRGALPAVPRPYSVLSAHNVVTACS